jgi:hypothetical protein
VVAHGAQGDSPVALAQSFGAQHNLGADAVNSVAQHIVSKAGKFMKRVFFYFPFYVEVEGKSKMMNLTVYEDSDSAELGSKVAKKYGSPFPMPCLPALPSRCASAVSMSLSMSRLFLLAVIPCGLLGSQACRSRPRTGFACRSTRKLRRARSCV